MRDEERTKEGLIAELNRMRRRIADMEGLESHWKETEDALRKSEEKFRNIAETAADAFIIADSNGKIVFWNNGAQRIFGYTEDEIMGQPLTILMPESERATHRKGMERVKSTGQTTYFGRIAEMRGLKKDMTEFPIELSVSMWRVGEEIFYSGVIRDITKRKQLEADLEKMATTDKLTQVFNRSKLYSLMENELERALRYKHPLSMIMFDVDHFKNVNDTHGHAAGDYVLRTLAQIVKENLRETDYLVRWGGEEFLIVAPETELERARVLAERIRKAVEDYQFGLNGRVTVSLGAAQFRRDDTTDTFVKRADDAMYAAKKKGRNQVEVIA